MTSTYTVEDLVPHSGRMSLLTRIVDHGEDWLLAEVDIRPDSMFADEKGVPAWVGLEYLAQAIGAYSGLQERRAGSKPKLGFLLGTRKYSSSAEYFPTGSTLTIKINVNLQAENGLGSFDCTLSSEHCDASGRLNVFQPDNASEFLQGEKSE
ncbi:ApeP family dehydratase [Marinomonas transparens]|uniref:Hotdog family protein n=1 Tax=Marinomonas transparens TaxID=2795388 RepID=A0A934JXC6_9GAMM|nr:hotdog family protein [Marinomonas transparens]MBJ7538692.1 hotdog family protein [Marinomonas transparens]